MAKLKDKKLSTDDISVVSGAGRIKLASSVTLTEEALKVPSSDSGGDQAYHFKTMFGKPCVCDMGLFCLDCFSGSSIAMSNWHFDALMAFC